MAPCGRRAVHGTGSQRGGNRRPTQIIDSVDCAAQLTFVRVPNPDCPIAMRCKAATAYDMTSPPKRWMSLRITGHEDRGTALITRGFAALGLSQLRPRPAGYCRSVRTADGCSPSRPILNGFKLSTR